MLKEQLKNYMEAHRQEMIDDISALVGIRSDRGEPVEGGPFGAGPKAALLKAMEICAATALRRKTGTGMSGRPT